MDIVKAGASNEEDEQIIKPQASTPALDTSDWPLLLKNYSKRTSLYTGKNFMGSLDLECLDLVTVKGDSRLFGLGTNLEVLIVLIRTGHFTPIPHGCAPHKRDLKSYIQSGVINLDKPSNPSSHEVVSWIKRILRLVGDDWKRIAWCTYLDGIGLTWIQMRQDWSLRNCTTFIPQGEVGYCASY